LSEDYRNRVWEERSKLAGDVVAAWDMGAYRLAEARLRILSGDHGLLEAMDELRESGKALGKAWRLEPRDDHLVDTAWHAHRQALAGFAAASSRTLHRAPAYKVARVRLDLARSAAVLLSASLIRNGRHAPPARAARAGRIPRYVIPSYA